MRIRKSTFRYIEQEIYDYHKSKRLFEDITKDIIFATNEKHEVRGTEISDPTFSTASMLVSDKVRSRIATNMNAIDLAFRLLDTTKNIILQDKYWKRPYLTWTIIGELYFQDRRSIYNWRSALVIEIAKSLGLH